MKAKVYTVEYKEGEKVIIYDLKLSFNEAMTVAKEYGDQTGKMFIVVGMDIDLPVDDTT